MARTPKAATAVVKADKFEYLELDSFKVFKDHKINTIQDLSDFIEQFGVHRIMIRSPNSKSKMTDRLEAEEGTWEVGVRLNKFYYDWVRSGPCDTLAEALEKVLGIKIEAGDDGLLV